MFISHASKDAGLASRIANALDPLGLSAFVYENYRVGGQNRFEVIGERITECPYFVLVLTKRARSSQWVNQEIGFAAANDKELIPLVGVSPVRKRRMPHFGFAELSDPLDLDPGKPESAIGELLRTLMSYARRDKYWQGMIRLTCKCDWRGRKGVRNLTQWDWACPSCHRIISVSPVTFEPIPQVP